ncbi:hypothetical protein Aph01nite_12860 [Acrocarpospora phusangensis]|uniref:Uncharacterized protein n=1 Tax=Acrocarpospora phusangensis TaxID=1070424 RepID=A0A919Q6D0_9ACTN|nr:hypothetical protein [Acrocarpospora phusangensis]GIH22976.1 hypothetical protein Aph01nite_12860 [Acrocarpospora phusangensis]
MPTEPDDESAGHTHHTRFRIPRPMWDAFGRVTERMGGNRTARLLDHVRADIRDHGDEKDLADLEAGERELRERRSRKGGRPPGKKANE